MRIIRRPTCIRGTARYVRCYVYWRGWRIYLKLKLLHYPSSLDLVTFFLPSIFSNLVVFFFLFRNIAHYRFLVNGRGHGRSNERSICHCTICRVKWVFAHFTPLNTMDWERTRE